MAIRKLLRALTLTLAIYGFAGWFYIAENAVFHPVTLHMQLTHFASQPHEDTFGAICFAVSILSCFFYLMLREDSRKR